MNNKLEGSKVQPLRVYRARLGLTQRELAARAQVSQGTVDRAERGLEPSIPTMHKIAQALGVLPDEITEFHRYLHGDQATVTPQT